MASDIPLARDALLVLADWLDEDGNDFEAGVLRLIVSGHMHRSFIGRFTPPKRTSLNPVLANQIRLFARDHPDWSQDEIGRVFNVAGGRVSEALAGHDWSPGRARLFKRMGLLP
jgi:hypothetical protein